MSWSEGKLFINLNGCFTLSALSTAWIPGITYCSTGTAGGGVNRFLSQSACAQFDAVLSRAVIPLHLQRRSAPPRVDTFGPRARWAGSQVGTAGAAQSGPAQLLICCGCAALVVTAGWLLRPDVLVKISRDRPGASIARGGILIGTMIPPAKTCHGLVADRRTDSRSSSRKFFGMPVTLPGTCGSRVTLGEDNTSSERCG